MRIRFWVIFIFVFGFKGVDMGDVARADSVGEKVTLAVLSFENNTPDPEEFKHWEGYLPSLVSYHLDGIDRFRLVVRSRISAMLDEIALSETGLIDPSTAQRVGKLLGAQYLLLGNFMIFNKDQMMLTAHIVRTETGHVVKAEMVEGKEKELPKMVGKLIRRIAKNLDIKVEKEEKKHLEREQNRPFQAVLHFSKGLELEDAGEMDKAVEMYRKALGFDASFSKAEERIEAIGSGQPSTN